MTGVSATSIDPLPTENMSKTLEQILDVLRKSTIAEQRDENIESNFWTTYKKFSEVYDKDFVEQANDDMAIILTFAGLFSAVNSTFIIGMQPNPTDTTNALMLQIINIMVNGPNAVDISTLTSSTSYSSSTAWMQALSYASLAFSVLAAFGAVMGKQWLNSYKVPRGDGSLEERGLQRQMRFDGIEHWQLRRVLKAFLIPLQISVFLFGLSLGAIMWTQQTTISTIIILTTGSGVLFYAATILISLSHPDSPFQTAGSAIAKAICKRFLPLLPPKPTIKLSAIRWLLETSMTPDVVEPAAAMISRAQWPSELDASALYERLRDTLTTYHDRHGLLVECAKAMGHLCVQPVKISKEIVSKKWDTWDSWESARNRLIYDSFIAGRKAWEQLKGVKTNEDRQKLRANSRTALRKMVVYGSHDCISLPDNEEMIWHGDLQWRDDNRGLPSVENFDWLIDYLTGTLITNAADHETQGDALLVLGAMNGLGSKAKRAPYIKALIRCMTAGKHRRVQFAAVRAISNAREELSSIVGNSIPQLLELFSQLSEVFGSPDDPMFGHQVGGAHCYLRLIFSLAKNVKWHDHLREHHVEKCTALSRRFHADEEISFYIVGIYLHISSTGNKPHDFTQDSDWRALIIRAWAGLTHIRPGKDFYHCIEILPTFVTATKTILKKSCGVDFNLVDLSRSVDQVSRKLEDHVSLGDKALSVVQQLSDHLNGCSWLETELADKIQRGPLKLLAS